MGDVAANEYIKAVLGTSVATGTAVIPNNFVAGLVGQIAANNIYRDLFNVVNGVTGAGVDIPYEVTGITAALLQGAYGSNKDVRDFSFNRATATLYTIAQIADIGNQLLRQSNGAAEAAARRRLGKSIGIPKRRTSPTARARPSRSASSRPSSPSATRPGSRPPCRPSLGLRPSVVASRRWRHAASRGQPRHRDVADRLLGDGHRRSRHLVRRWLGRRSGWRRSGQSADHLGVGRPDVLRPGWPSAQVGTALIIEPPTWISSPARSTGSTSRPRRATASTRTSRASGPRRSSVQRRTVCQNRTGAEGNRHLALRLDTPN